MRSNTKAREAILNLLQSNTNRQFTVEDIANEVILNGIRIPTATIYRTLVFFEEQKLINKFEIILENIDNKITFFEKIKRFLKGLKYE